MRRGGAGQRRRPTAVAVLASLLLLLLLTESQAGMRNLQLLLNSQQKMVSELGYCDFDHVCKWTWNTTDGVFVATTAPMDRPFAPTADASGKLDGKFLWMTGAKEGQLQSLVIPRTRPNCYMQVALHQVEMKHGNISLIIETADKSTLAEDREGNNNATWEVTTFNLRGMSQDFTIILEMKAPFENSSIAIDNISLVNCFQGSRVYMADDCKTDFRCNDSSCLLSQYVCDFSRDCKTGEDETEYCDKMPPEARCNFENPENRWCGWTNQNGSDFQWTLQHGMPDERMSPVHDFVYKNASDTYAYADMTRYLLGSRGILNSPTFNPTPPYHSNPQSLYGDTCKVRFRYFQSGLQSTGLTLFLIQLKPQKLVKELWKLEDRSNSDNWIDWVVRLPNIRYKYYLQFVVTKGYISKAFAGIDNISLTPECFGIGVPPDIVGSFDYYNQKIPPWNNKPPKHIDFTNKTVIQIGTCGQTGRFGPTAEQCLYFYNDTEVELMSETTKAGKDDISMLRSKGIQRWTAPSGGHYTLIAKGARGGAGALARDNNAHGAMVHGVVELEKGQNVYFMIGQPGSDACPKTLTSNSTCQQSGDPNSTQEYWSIIRDIKKYQIKDGGGGGGGATYIFTVDSSGKQHPLLIAGGGGGLGPTNFQDDGVPDGKGLVVYHRNATHGVSHKLDSGAGGGWLKGISNDSNHVSFGMALTEGGIGGLGCGSNQQGYGDGGFGGGGGGCLSGGGGGGYSGGDTGHAASGNGEGGYSYASPKMMFVGALEKANSEAGEAMIIPWINGCGCKYRCVVIDEHLTDTRCICPTNWIVDANGKTCSKISGADDERREKVMISLICVSIVLLVALSVLCISLYNRYQTRKAKLRRRQVMFGNGTELTSLRVVSDSMMTEFNPNYEFAGNLYSFKDLDQIPRENITLVKPLGQGAFGEVFQGIYKMNRSEEYPVAVKTLPSLSTSQAEADFMMEALIMSKFRHPNIVQFIGVSFDKHPRYIILELLAGGDLKNFLREERPRPDRTTTLSMVNLINCAYDVAKGCKYMEDARFIHRDIAARNCLLTCKGPGRAVKIADFGMARDIYRSDYYRKGGKAMLPIKWMPPESFLDGIFTTKTDVWAFGVLLWEIMSFGYMPYTGCANREVMSMVTSGGRLERPAGCPDPIYGIMTRCWHPHPEERPSFATIVERIGYCLQDPDVINHPTPNYDLLPDCDREITTIMRPDPETECINMHNDLDRCAYMQPRNVYPMRYRMGQPPGIVYASLRHASEDRENCNNLPAESPPAPLHSPAHEPHYHKHNSAPEDREVDEVCDNRDCNKQQPDEDESNANLPISSSRQPPSGEVDNNVNKTQESKVQPGGQNGNGESTTTTDTNSDSLFITSCGTPPDTISSSPNTRTSSPNRAVTGGGGATNNGNGSPNNVNGIIRKNALKAALSLDPSALCRGTIPYEKIAFTPPKPKLSNPGSTELRKDSLSHELPREEECSC